MELSFLATLWYCSTTPGTHSKLSQELSVTAYYMICLCTVYDASADAAD